MIYKYSSVTWAIRKSAEQTGKVLCVIFIIPEKEFYAGNPHLPSNSLRAPVCVCCNSLRDKELAYPGLLVYSFVIPYRIRKYGYTHTNSAHPFRKPLVIMR
jgi:hypothetical protein